MKRIYMASAILSLLLSACNSDQLNQTLQTTNSETIISQSDANLSAPETSLETDKVENRSILTKDEIYEICESFNYTIYGCKDGSQIIALSTYSNYYNIHHDPAKLSDGKYDFFRKLSPSNDIIYHEDGLVEIPLCINNSGDYRFTVKGTFSLNEGKGVLNEMVFAFLSDEDYAFNQEFSDLGFQAYETNYPSRISDRNLSDEELEVFLKSCIYNGNLSVLSELYGLMPQDDLTNKYKMELALFHENGVSISEENPYKTEIFYGESSKLFPQEKSLNVVAKSLQTGKSFEELGIQEIETNFSWEEVCGILESWDDRDSVYLNDNVLGVYKFDLNHDGLMEILMFSPGGTMGNEYWDVIYLDENGGITDISSGDGMSSMFLYCLDGEYFWTSPMIDFNDKEFLGLYMYALNSQGETMEAEIWFDKIGSEIVLSDEHIEIEDSYYLDWHLDSFIDEYKRYEYNSIGNEIQPEISVQEIFDDLGNNGIYGKFDVNNDGIDDWTKVFMFFPSNRNPYYCNYNFVDGKTNEKIDFQNYFRKQNFNLRLMKPYPMNGKNYFICIGKGYGNYMVKLIEIKDMEPIEIHSWLVSIKNQLLVKAGRYTGSGF